MAMPAVPGADFVLIESQLRFALLETAFNGPAGPSGQGQIGQGGPFRGEDEKGSDLWLGVQGAAKQHPPLPTDPRWRIHCQQLPIVQTRPLTARPGAQARPLHLGSGLDRSQQRADRALLRALPNPGIPTHAEHLALSAFLQGPPQPKAISIHGISGDPPGFHPLIQSPYQHPPGQFCLGLMPDLAGNARRLTASAV